MTSTQIRKHIQTLSLSDLEAMWNEGEEWDRTSILPDGMIAKAGRLIYVTPNLSQLVDVRAEVWRELAGRRGARVEALLGVLRRVRADRPSAHSDDVWSAIENALGR